MNILGSENQEPNQTEVLLDEIKYKASNNLEKKLFQDISKKIIREVFKTVENITRELGYDFSILREGEVTLASLIINIDWNWENLTFSYLKGGASIAYRFSDRIFHPIFGGYITGNEIVVVAIKLFLIKRNEKTFPIEENFDKEKIELLRIPLSSEPDFTDFQARLEKFYFEGIESIM